MATPDKLEEAVGLVLYELWMLRECAHMPKPVPRVPRNLRYEGLALHARVLRDFFFTKVYQKGKDKGKRATQPEDIVAVDYFTTQFSWPYTSSQLTPYLEENKERMDRAMAHLSFDRLKYETQDKDWAAEKLLSEIGVKWFEFIDALHKDNEAAAGWFRHHRRARLVRFSSPF